MNIINKQAHLKPVNLHFFKEAASIQDGKSLSQFKSKSQYFNYDQMHDFQVTATKNNSLQTSSKNIEVDSSKISQTQKKKSHSFKTISNNQHWDIKYKPITKLQRNKLRLNNLLSKVKGKPFSLAEDINLLEVVKESKIALPKIHHSWRNRFIQDQPRQLERTISKPKHETIIPQKPAIQKPLFIINSQIQDLKKLKIEQINMDDFNDVKFVQYFELSKDIYRKREIIIQHCQEKLKLSTEFRFLFLFNEQPFQFFEEIPEVRQYQYYYFTGKNLKCEFWITLFNLHKIQTKKRKISINRVLDKLSKTNNIQDIYQILQQRVRFMECIMTHQQESDYLQVTPSFLFTSDYYRTDDMQEVEMEITPVKIKPEFFKLEVDVKKEKIYDDDEVDFSLKYKSISPKTIDKLINFELPRRRVSSFLRLEDHKEFCLKKVHNFNKIKQNQNKYFNMQKCVTQNHPLLVMKNLPSKMKRTDFTRQELHEVFSRYKALLTMECQGMKGMNASMLPKGLTFPSFCAGLTELSMASNGVCEHLFNLFSTSKVLDFDGFLKVINLITAKKNDGKIKLILNLMDKDQNGLLSYARIKERCYQMMYPLLIIDESELSITKMGDYITRTIFDAVQISYNDEIPIDKIRQLIESNSPESQVLIMMCCGDVNYLK